MEPFQDTSHPESTADPADLSNLGTDTPTPRSHGVSVTSSYAESEHFILYSLWVLGRASFP